MYFGDYNFPNCDWNSDLSGQPGVLKELMDDLYASNFIYEGTRNENILDLVISNNEFSIIENEIIENVAFSDHRMIITKFKC